jgi:hypothetical protein
MITLWHELADLQASVEQVRDAFVRLRGGGTAPRPQTLFLPEPLALGMRLHVGRLLTPLDAKTFDGFRLCRHGLRLLEVQRTSGTIHSHPLESDVDVVSVLVRAFIAELGRHFFTFSLFPGALAGTDGGVAFAPELVVGLVEASLTAEHQPRLMPRVRLPTKQELVQGLPELIPSVFVDPTGQSVSMTACDGGFLFVEIGERGGRREMRCADRGDAMLLMVRELFGADAMDDDRRWRFAPASLLSRH